MSCSGALTVEHRWGKRVPMSLAVKVGEAGALVRGRLRNVSLSGGYIEGVPTISLWSNVSVWLERHCHKRSGRSRVKAYVVRGEPGGIAVEWCEFAPRAIRRLVATSEETAVPATNPRASNEVAMVTDFAN